MLRLAAGNRGGDTCFGNAAVDAIAGQRQPPRTEMALLELLDQIRGQSLERLGCGLGMGRWLLKLDQRARRRIGRRRGQRFILAPEHPVERIDDIFRTAETPREREAGHVEKRADRLEAEPFERTDGVGVAPESGDVQWLQLVMPAKAGIHVAGLLQGWAICSDMDPSLRWGDN